ncbi:MAG: hypothetical protein ABI759_08965 [Candidatus Solibacter sp.]
MSAPSPVKAPPAQPQAGAPPRVLPYVVALLLLPVLVLWRQDDPLYTPLWQTDPWFYLGYFRDLVNFKRDLFPGFYYGSRLPWVLPGYAMHHLFSPLLANAIMHLGVHSVCVLSLFFTLRRIAGIRSAYLAAMIFGLHPWLWAATGWDHVNGAAVAYYLLAMALLTRAADKPAPPWTLLAAGMAVAGSIWTHLYLAAFAPFLALHYFVLVWTWQREPLRRALARFCLWTGSGFALFTAPLCIINGLWVDGNFWFWTPSLRTAQAVTTKYIWTESLWYQGQLVSYLWIVTAASIVALALLPTAWKQVRESRKTAGLLFAVELLGPTTLMVLLQFRGITLLGHYYYACYLFPAVFLVLAAAYWQATGTMDAKTWQITSVVATLAFGLIWVSPRSNGILLKALPAWVPLLLTAGVLAAAFYLRRSTLGTWLSLSALVLLTSMMYDGDFHYVGVHSTRQEYVRVMNNRRIVEQDRHGQPTRFWYDREEPGWLEYFALNASYMAEFARIGERFPRDCDPQVEPGSLAVVTSSKPNTPDLAISALTNCWQSAGVKPALQTVQRVDRPEHPYTLVVLKAVDDFSQRRPLRVNFDGKGRGTLELVPDAVELRYLPLEMWGASAGASVQRIAGDLTAQTPPGASDYAFTYAPLIVPETATYRFELKFRLLSGKIAFGAFPADESRWLANDIGGRSTPEGHILAFTAPLQAGQTVLMRIANNNATPAPSRFAILETSVTAIAPPK